MLVVVLVHKPFLCHSSQAAHNTKKTANKRDEEATAHNSTATGTGKASQHLSDLQFLFSELRKCWKTFLKDRFCFALVKKVEPNSKEKKFLE